MNIIVDAVLQDLAMDGDAGSPLPTALEAAVRRYHASESSSYSGNDQGTSQNVDKSYCQYIWKLLSQRQGIAIALCKPPAQSTSSTPEPSNHGETGEAIKAKKTSKNSPSSIKGTAAIPGAENLVPIQGDQWRSIPLPDLLAQFNHGDIRVVCSPELIRNAQAPGRQHEITAPMAWAILQLTSRARGQGIEGGELMRQLKVKGSATFYLLKQLIDFDLVSKFSTRETQKFTTVVVHNKFKHECIYYKNRIQASRPHGTAARLSSMSVADPFHDVEEDFRRLEQEEEQQGQSSARTSSSKSKGKQKVGTLPIPSGNVEAGLTSKGKEALALLDSEREPRLVEQWLPVRQANAPGNRIIKKHERRRPRPRQKQQEQQQQNSASGAGIQEDEDEDLLSQNAKDGDDEGSDVGDYEEVVQEGREALQDQEAEIAEAEEKADADADDDGSGPPSTTKEQEPTPEGDVKQYDNQGRPLRKVAYYTYSTLPSGTWTEISPHRRSEITHRILKLLSLAPMASMTKNNLRIRLGYPKEDDGDSRRKYIRDVYRLFNTHSLIEPVTYSYYARGRRSQPDAGIEVPKRGDPMSAKYVCWRLTEKGHAFLRDVERKPLEAELRRQLTSVAESTLVHEITFDRLHTEIVNAAGVDGIVRNDLLDALKADRDFGRYYQRVVEQGYDTDGHSNKVTTAATSQFESAAEPFPLLDTILLTLSDRATASSVDTSRFFTLRTLLLRSAQENVNLLVSANFARTLSSADVDSKGGTVADVGVGGWITLLGDERWTDPSQQWLKCSLNILGPAKRGPRKRDYDDDDLEEEEEAEGVDEGEGGDANGASAGSSSTPAEPAPKRLKKATAKEQKPKATKKIRSRKDPSLLKHPQASARRYAKLDEERKAREAAAAEAVAAAAAAFGREVKGAAVGTLSAAVEQEGAAVGTSSAAVEKEGAAIRTSSAAVEALQTPAPSAALPRSPTVDSVTGSPPAKRVRIEVPASSDAGDEEYVDPEPEKDDDAVQGSAGPERPKLDIRRGSSRMSLLNIRRETAMVTFLRDNGTNVVREDRFRTLFSAWLEQNQQLDAKEIRSLILYPKERTDLVQRSEQLDMVYTSVMDPQTNRPRQVAILYLTSMSHAELQSAIQSLQEEGDARSVSQYAPYGGAVTSHDRHIADTAGPNPKPTTLKRLPRILWSKRVQVVDAPGFELEDVKRSQPSTRRSKKRTKKVVQRAELSAKQEIRRQRREAKQKRKKFWDDTWTRILQAHDFTEHQRLWLESSMATASYRFLDGLPSARHMNVEQLMRKRVEHALSVPEEELVIQTKTPRMKPSEMSTARRSKKGRVPRVPGESRQRNRGPEGPKGQIRVAARAAPKSGENALTEKSASKSTYGGDEAGNVGASRRARAGQTRPFELDELTRDVGVILTCRDKERGISGKTNWISLRQLGIESIMVFKKRWTHLKSFPAEDAYLRKLEITWMELWRAKRGSESLPDHDPAHPTDFDLKQHLEFFRKNVDKNRVTSMALPADNDRPVSACPLEEWVDEVPLSTRHFDDLYVPEATCVQANRLKTFLNWPLTLPREEQVSDSRSQGDVGERQKGLALTTIKVLLHSREEANSARIVPFLSEAVGREPITAALNDLLERSIIRPAHVEGRLLPVLNFEFSQEYLSALDGLGPSIPGEDFVRHTRKIVDDMAKGVPVTVDAGAESEDVGALLQLISTGMVDLVPSVSELQKSVKELPVTEINARDIVDADISVTVVASLSSGTSQSEALSGVVSLNWDDMIPAWVYWLGQQPENVSWQEHMLLRDAESVEVMEKVLRITRQAGAEGITKRALMAQFAGQVSTLLSVVQFATAGERPVLFWAGYDEFRLVSCRFAEAWALPRPKVINEGAVVISDGFFVPRAWSNQLGWDDTERRKACFNAILTDCKYRPGTTLAQLVTLFNIALSRLDVLDMIGLMERAGLLEIRLGEWRGQDALLRAKSDREVMLDPTNKLWWEDGEAEGHNEPLSANA
ncbi:unnamed protein product [Tilletia controversa]|nr:unnamed protein product [Tilletia controversa]CAD6933842.1 unnamed protein product [Tilletia controversa]CAD6970301.1 unnamed protein product [Tilletia controversa]